MKKEKLFLLDIMPLLYRAHFATIGKRFATGSGIDTRTPLVFFNYIFQILAEEKPNAIAAVLDSTPHERLSMYESYKENREELPDEISDAFPYAMRLMEALRIPVFKVEGQEADDVIATIAKAGSSYGFRIFIVSPDKDFAQLVNENIFLLRPAYRGQTLEVLDATGVKNKFGVEPDQIVDFLALKGDAVDNIPGVKGIGDKTAASLLNEFRSIEEILEGADKIRQPKLKDSIIGSEKQLRESKKLAVLNTNLSINVDADELKTKIPDDKKLFSLLDELEFIRIKERIIKLGIAGKETAQAERDARVKMDVSEWTLQEALDAIWNKDKISFAYTGEFPEMLFLFYEDADEICRIHLKNNAEWLELIRELEDEKKIISGWNLKPFYKKVESLGLSVKRTFADVQIQAYLLDPDARIEWPVVARKYKFHQYDLPEIYLSINFLPGLVAANDELSIRIDALGLGSLLYKTELPLTKVLANMELTGTKIDLRSLGVIEGSLASQLKKLESDLFAMAGKEFNLNSPGQTAEILKQIADPSELKRTPTGQVSTAEPFLIDIAPKYPFVDALLQHRKLNKIITTYVVSLPKYVDEKTKKIHPTFQQVVAGTGRLSCTDPNLQNLPVRNETGREVRRSVIASGPDFSILSIDYNQVELRLLAALSGDEVMIEAFRSGKDIHTITACKIFNVEESQITKEIRTKAKGVNFGIAYGITPWGLATRLKITQAEGKAIIDAYFEEFPAVKEYLERSVKETRERGYSRTAFGRIRYVEGIDSKNITTRKTAERIAVNAPLQGLAADIIKNAMVDAHAFINENKLRTRMVLQVHDELVFDAHNDEIADFVPQIKRIMENQGDFPVQLAVNISSGPNWLELTVI